MDAQMREQFWSGQRSLRGPAWRITAAQEMTNFQDRSVALMWDQLTIEAAKYFALRANDEDGQERAAAAYPKIDAAITLQADIAKADVIKLMVLVDSPVEAIAARVGVEREVVDVWEQLYFDVRLLRSAVDWLSIHVVNKEQEAGNTALAGRMKLALTAGVDGVNALLAMAEGVPLDEADRLYQRKLQLHLKLDEAVDFPIDSERNRMKFVKLCADLQLAEQRLELAGKKLAARCAAARDRHELAKMRMEYAQEVAAVKADEKSQLAERRRRSQKERSAAAAHEQELQHYAHLAEKKAATCRAAESPLARLTWGTSKAKPVAVAESITPIELEKQAEPIFETAEPVCESDIHADPYEMNTSAWMQELELVTQGEG